MKRNLYKLLSEKYVTEIIDASNLEPKDYGIEDIKSIDTSKPERAPTWQDLQKVMQIVKIQKALEDLKDVGAGSIESDDEWRKIYRDLHNSGLSYETISSMVKRERERNK
jgi:hypothetical protein